MAATGGYMPGYGHCNQIWFPGAPEFVPSTKHTLEQVCLRVVLERCGVS